MEELIAEYSKLLKAKGTPVGETILSRPADEVIARLNQFDCVSITDELAQYLSVVSGYDIDKERGLGISSGEYIWGMQIIAIENIENCYEIQGCVTDDDDDDFWPKGFIPILQFNNSDFVLVNCIPESPTRGSVYDFGETEGVSYVADSLRSFFQNYMKVIENFEIDFSDPNMWDRPDYVAYTRIVANIFGISQDALDERGVTDWKTA